jgi:hypothetical protein
MKPPIVYEIIKYLEERPYEWHYGGSVAREVGQRTNHKESVIERRLREMTNVDDAKIEKQMVSNPNGRGAKVIQYKLKI